MPKSRWLPLLVLLAVTLGVALLAGAVAGSTVAVFLALVIGGVVLMFRVTPTGFVPDEDVGAIFVQALLPRPQPRLSRLSVQLLAR